MWTCGLCKIRISLTNYGENVNTVQVKLCMVYSKQTHYGELFAGHFFSIYLERGFHLNDNSLLQKPYLRLYSIAIR